MHVASNSRHQAIQRLMLCKAAEALPHSSVSQSMCSSNKWPPVFDHSFSKIQGVTGKASFLLQVEVSSPQADDLGRVRQITQEKEALAQQRARAEQAREVCPRCPHPTPCQSMQPYCSTALIELLGNLLPSSTINKLTHTVPRHEIRVCKAVPEAMPTFSEHRVIQDQTPTVLERKLACNPTLHC